MTTRTINVALATSPPALLDRELRASVAAMSKRLRGVPKQFRAWRFDVTRQEKRARPLGQYPDFALAVLRSGAPASDALKPLDELRGWIQSHVPALSCLADALESHAKESGEATTAAIKLQRHADRPTPAALDEWIREAEEAREALTAAIDAAYRLKYGSAR